MSTLQAHPVARAARRSSSATSSGRTAGRWRRRRGRSCAASSTGSPSAGSIANIGSELEFFLFRETYDSAREKRYHDLTPGEPLQRRLLDPRDDDGRGRDPADPARHGGRGHPRRGLEGRVQLRPARGELPLLRRPHDGRQPRRLQERRQGDRPRARATRSRSWPSTTSARATRATSTARLWDEDGTAFADGDGHQTRPLPPRSWRGSSPRTRELTLLLRAERELLQALRLGVVRADDAGLGRRQPHVRVPGRRARPGAARREPARGRRHEPIPRLRGDHRRRPARDRERPRPRGRVRRQRLRRDRQAAGAVEPRHRDRPLRGLSRWRARRSGRRSSTTTCTTRARSSGRSRPRSPIGRSSAASSGSSGRGGTPRSGEEAVFAGATTVSARVRSRDQRGLRGCVMRFTSSRRRSVRRSILR